MRKEDEKLRKTIEVVSFYCGITVDLFEQEFRDHKNWPYIRSRILRIFGDRGLKGKIQEIHLDGGHK